MREQLKKVECNGSKPDITFYMAMVACIVMPIVLCVMLIILNLERTEEKRKTEELHDRIQQLENRLVAVHEKIALLKEVDVSLEKTTTETGIGGVETEIRK